MVAILKLEVTGIPELSSDRRFPWPKAFFVERQTRRTSHVFEVRSNNVAGILRWFHLYL